MAASFVLIHSPSVGPRTWQPVAHRLAELGWAAAVPSLLNVTDHGPPFWPWVVDAVRAGLGTVRQDQGVVLVAHSNAGLFIPVITSALAGQVRGCIFVDAALPPASGAAPVAPPELLALLRDKASGGLLPRWTDWWDEEEVAPLFPDQATRQAVTEEQPRLPLSYFEASVPVPAGWEAQPCAYLLFGPRMTSWPPRRAGGAGSSSSFQERISTSWSIPTAWPVDCWRSSSRWVSPSLEQQGVMELSHRYRSLLRGRAFPLATVRGAEPNKAGQPGCVVLLREREGGPWLLFAAVVTETAVTWDANVSGARYGIDSPTGGVDDAGCTGQGDRPPAVWRGEGGTGRLGADRARWGASGALYPQTALAGLNPCPRVRVRGERRARSVDGQVPRNVTL
jgi:hypothetical protein